MITASEIHKMLCPDNFAQHCLEYSRLFALAAVKGYPSEQFCKDFMLSEYSVELDRVSVKDLLPLAEDMLCSFEHDNTKPKLESHQDTEVMRWVGHIYCYWHLKTNESSAEIYRQAPFSKMLSIYTGYHCLAEDLVIQDLKELYVKTL